MVHSTNPALKSLQLLEDLRAVLKHTFSHDVHSDIKRHNLADLHDGFLDTVASQTSRLAEDVDLLKSQLKAAVNHGMYDDKDDLVSVDSAADDSAVTEKPSSSPKALNSKRPCRVALLSWKSYLRNQSLRYGRASRILHFLT
jgi:hypothetical protein